jgi:hypothetical protein
VHSYGYRYYSTELGRWINRYPIGAVGGINVYGYVENAAILFIDSLGLSPVEPPDNETTKGFCHIYVLLGHGLDPEDERAPQYLPAVPRHREFLNRLTRVWERRRSPNFLAQRIVPAQEARVDWGTATSSWFIRRLRTLTSTIDKETDRIAPVSCYNAHYYGIVKSLGVAVGGGDPNNQFPISVNPISMLEAPVRQDYNGFRVLVPGDPSNSLKPGFIKGWKLLLESIKSEATLLKGSKCCSKVKVLMEFEDDSQVEANNRGLIVEGVRLLGVDDLLPPSEL